MLSAPRPASSTPDSGPWRDAARRPRRRRVTSAAPGLSCDGHVGAERHREVGELGSAPGADPEAGGGQAQHGGGVGGAAAESGRDRDVLLDRDAHRRPVPAEALAKGVQRGGGEVRAFDAGADDLVGRRTPISSSMTSSASVIGWNNERISCRPSARSGPDVEAEVELRGRAGRRASTEALQLAREL